MSHVLSSETHMPVARLVRLQDRNEELKVLIRWKVSLLWKTHWSPAPKRAYKDVPHMVLRLLQRKNPAEFLGSKARRALGF